MISYHAGRRTRRPHFGIVDGRDAPTPLQECRSVRALILQIDLGRIR